MSRAVATLALLLLLAAPGSAAAAKKTSTCTSKAGKAVLKTYGKPVQTLASGQYRAYRVKGGTWTFCDGKRPVKSAFKSYSFDFDGQTNTGVRLYSRPGKCVALQLKPSGNGYPQVPTVDMRPSAAQSGSSINQIDRAAPGARIVKIELSSTCLVVTAYVSAAGARTIQLNPILPPNVLQDKIALSAESTDADLKALSLDGDKISWTDNGVKQSKTYSGLPPG